MGGLLEYRSGRKANWRRAQWNQIVDRLYVPKRDAVVVLLSGPDALDARVAISKGFSRHNLINVDTELACVRRIRRQGFLAVQLDIKDVVASLGTDIHAVVLDSNWKVSHPLFVRIGVIMLALLCQGGGPTMCINVQRGREDDPEAMHLVRSAQKAGLTKCRIYPAMSGILCWMAKKLAAGDIRAEREVAVLLFKSVGAMWTRNYMSNRVVMDSAVFTVPGFKTISGSKLIPVKEDRKVVRRLAALRACRTMMRSGHRRIDG